MATTTTTTTTTTPTTTTNSGGVAQLTEVSLAPDKEAEAVAKLRRAFEHDGFAYLVDHGLSHQEIADALALNARFHALPLEEKQSVAMQRDFRGFVPLNTSTLRATGVGSARRPNQSESFVMIFEDPPGQTTPLHGANKFPRGMPELQPACEAFQRRLEAIGLRVVRLFGLAMHGDAQAYLRFFDHPTWAFRLLSYLPARTDRPADEFGIAPHTDYGFLTLLAQDQTGGLQVLRGDQALPDGDASSLPDQYWLDVEPKADALVLNIGDFLAHWTAGHLKATRHRVINRSTTARRYAIALFFDPRWDTVGNGLAYADHLMSRIRTNYDQFKDKETGQR